MTRYHSHRSKHGVPAFVKAGLLVLLLSGCAATPPSEPAAPIPEDGVGLEGAALLARAEGRPPDEAAPLYLQAAWVFIEEDNPAGAFSAYQAMEPGWLEPGQLEDYQLLRAYLALLDGNAQAARTALEEVSPSRRQSLRGARIESELCALEGKYQCALTRLVGAVGEDPSENERVWSWLNLGASLDPSQMPKQASEVLRGWLALHRAVVAAPTLADAQRRAGSWLAANPTHPAALIPPSAVSTLMAHRQARMHVGLLLPLSGQLARAGEAVRDGFIGAMLRAEAAGWMNVSVYDTAAEPIPTLYERLLADRVDLIVGPLQKDAATSLNTLNPDVPALVLNYLDEQEVPAIGVRQVGLAIEDEAETIARRLTADAVGRALLFHNYDDWSLRARRVLLEQTDADLTVQPFTDVRTITEAVGSAMHVADSQARRDELAAALGVPLEFLPRARGDVDAVIALVDNGEANALVPALRFHFAEHLPVYASSQVARRSRTGQLTELAGFHVSELPWFLGNDPLFASMTGAFELERNPFASLFALGADAFRLAERTPLGADVIAMPVLGSTGLLKPQPDGRVRRELAWGTIDATGVTPELGTGH